MQWANRTVDALNKDLRELFKTRAGAVILCHERIRLAARVDELQALDNKSPAQVQKVSASFRAPLSQRLIQSCTLAVPREPSTHIQIT